MVDLDDNPVYDTLRTTRAMRRFTDEDVSDEEVLACLRAAIQAPSGGNIQPYQFVAVRDPAKRADLGRIYLAAHTRYEPAVARVRPEPADEAAARSLARNLAAAEHLAAHLHEAPVLVLVLMPKISMVVHDDDGPMDVGPTYASVYPAVAWFILAARSLGLGTCLTTVYRIYEDEVRGVCGIPDRYEVVALLPLGHPSGRWGVAPRRPAESITSWDTFGHKRR
jgi:nitroreductase